MTPRRWLIPLLLLLLILLIPLPSRCLDADKEIIRLQRDIALVDSDLRALQRSMDKRMEAMLALLQQTLDRVNEVHRANTIMQGKLSEQQKGLMLPVANLGVKVDQVVSDSIALRESLAALRARLLRLEQKAVDVENAIRIVQAPPSPPPLSEAMEAPPAGLTAEGLFQAAMRDKFAGHYDLALREFQDYLEYFGETEQSAAAQFHIAAIALNKGDTSSALEGFDVVVKRYPRSAKAPDALYMKAKTLQRQGKRSQAVNVLNSLVRRYPRSDAANGARTEINRLKTGSVSQR